MGLFDISKPRITKDEMSDARSVLYSKGFNDQDINEVKKIFRGDMTESRDIDNGIDAGELAAGIKWLKDNPSSHKLPPSKIAILEQVLKKKI